MWSPHFKIKCPIIYFYWANKIIARPSTVKTQQRTLDYYLALGESITQICSPIDMYYSHTQRLLGT